MLAKKLLAYAAAALLFGLAYRYLPEYQLYQVSLIAATAIIVLGLVVDLVGHHVQCAALLVEREPRDLLRDAVDAQRGNAADRRQVADMRAQGLLVDGKVFVERHQRRGDHARGYVTGKSCCHECS